MEPREDEAEGKAMPPVLTFVLSTTMGTPARPSNLGTLTITAYVIFIRHENRSL
jgi:hypothetical protein